MKQLSNPSMVFGVSVKTDGSEYDRTHCCKVWVGSSQYSCSLSPWSEPAKLHKEEKESDDLFNQR